MSQVCIAVIAVEARHPALPCDPASSRAPVRKPPAVGKRASPQCSRLSGRLHNPPETKQRSGNGNAGWISAERPLSLLHPIVVPGFIPSLREAGPPPIPGMPCPWNLTADRCSTRAQPTALLSDHEVPVTVFSIQIVLQSAAFGFFVCSQRQDDGRAAEARDQVKRHVARNARSRRAGGPGGAPWLLMVFGMKLHAIHDPCSRSKPGLGSSRQGPDLAIAKPAAQWAAWLADVLPPPPPSRHWRSTR